MYCGNCGAENPGDAAFCGACGAALPQGLDAGKKRLSRGGKTALILVAAGVVIAALLLLWAAMALGGGGPEDAAETFIHASMDEDGAEDLVDLLPPTLIRQMIREGYLDTRDELVRMLEDTLEERAEDYEDYFGDYRVRTKVLGVARWDSGRLRELLDEVGEDFPGEITQVAEVSLEVTVDGRRREETYRPAIQVFRIDGGWYVIDGMWDDPWYSF